MRDDRQVIAHTGTAKRAADVRRRRGVTFEDMAARRAERMVNLVLCLLSTRAFLTAEQIRRAVPGYEPDDHSERADEAFKRMFERDKAELRELGIPLETGRTSIFDVDDGYRIARRDYELPEIEFDPAEATAVGLASRLWQSATLSGAARTALLKLRAAGVEVDDRSGPGTFGPLDAAEPALGPLLDAVRERQAVGFDYRKSGAETVESRVVEPWGVLSWRGRWYLVGHDRGRNAPRSFRLSRLSGAVRGVGERGVVQRPDGIDLLPLVRGGIPDHSRVARVRVVGPGAARLRRMAMGVDGLSGAPAAEADATSAAGQELKIDYTDVDWLARIVAAAGPSVVALDPPELVRQVTALLQVAAQVSPSGRS
jgi:proteasome accessory factor B